MCPEHSIHEFFIHIGISARTHAGFISEVMSSVNPEGSLITSCKGTGDPMGWKVSARGGRTNVRLPHAAFGVPVIRLNGSVIVTGVVKLAMIRLPSRNAKSGDINNIVHYRIPDWSAIPECLYMCI